jgi:hypothetical protein
MWVPPQVSRELLAQREQYRADLETQAIRAKQLDVKSILDQFNYELKRIDPKLEMVRAGETVSIDSALRPGYYAVIRWNDGAPPSVINITGEHGEFVEPTSRVFEMLKRNDLWDPRNMRLLRQRERLADEAAQRQKIRDRQERQEEIMERVAAATRTQVSMNRDAPWSQNHAGSKRRHKAA